MTGAELVHFPELGVADRYVGGESPPSSVFPGVALLMVVDAQETALYEYLARTFAGIGEVKVLMERRLGDRRRAAHAVAVERRGHERRLSRGRRFALGYTAVHFGMAVPAAADRPAAPQPGDSTVADTTAEVPHPPNLDRDDPRRVAR